MHLTAKNTRVTLSATATLSLVDFFPPYRTCILNIIDIYEAPTEFGAWQVLYILPFRAQTLVVTLVSVTAMKKNKFKVILQREDRKSKNKCSETAKYGTFTNKF